MDWSLTSPRDALPPGSPPALEPLYCALFILLAFILSGAAQSWWFKSPLSARFAVPLDGGRTFRGRRLFGENKTWKGFVVMVPATTLAFAFLGALAGALPTVGARLWPLTPLQYAGVGAFTALGFMLGELPNSFIKRQLDIAPGGAPASAGARWLGFIVDRLDSVVGGLFFLSLLVPMDWQTWLWALGLGPVVHWLFSVVLYLIGVKSRPA